MTKKEEECLHFLSCIDDLTEAWRLLHEIKSRNRDDSVVVAAFQRALIDYSKPYKGSYGKEVDAKGKRIRIKHKLSTSFIPPHHIELHNRIIDLRDQVLAHSDLTVTEAKLYVVDTIEDIIPIRRQKVILGTEEFENIDAIINLIEQSLSNMYKQQKDLLATFLSESK